MRALAPFAFALSLIFIFSLFSPFAYAAALPAALIPTAVDSNALVPRAQATVALRPAVNTTSGPELLIISPKTRQAIPQSEASNGAGSGFNIPAVVWIGYSIATSLLLLLASSFAARGIENNGSGKTSKAGWKENWSGKLLSGVGLGLAGAIAAWHALANAMSATPLDDLLLTSLVLAVFLFLFILGTFRFAYRAGVISLALCGGIALGIRIILLRPGLLIQNSTTNILDAANSALGALFILNWVIILLLAILSALIFLFGKSRRIIILLSASSCSTFLLGLGGDLILQQQSGMSRGLRYLGDRNSNHLQDILTNGYKPVLTTQIIIGVSMGLIPVLAYAQHKLFPFRPSLDEDAELNINFPNESEIPKSGFWNTLKKSNSSRFSM